MTGIREFVLVLALVASSTLSVAQSSEPFAVGSGASDPTVFAFSGDDEINSDVLLNQNLDWLGVNSNPHSVAAIVQSDGSIVVTASNFRIVLSQNGQIISRSNHDRPDQGLNSLIAPYTVDARPIGLVRYDQEERFITSEKGTPLPRNGVVDDVLKAQQACLIASEEKLEEARLIEMAVSSDGLFAHAEIAALLLRRGVDPINLDGEVLRFVRHAHQYRRKWEARQDARWQRLIREDPAGNLVEKKGHAQIMGEQVGPYVSAALVGWATSAVLVGAGASPVVSHLSSAGSSAAGVHIVGDVGREAGGAYGRYIDETGHNPFYPGLHGNSPRPDKSVLDSMRDAFNRLFAD